LYPGYESLAAGISDVYRITVGRSGVLSQLRIRQNIPSSSSNTVTYTVLVNGVVTALSATVAGNATAGANVVNTASVVAGDELSVRVTRPANVSPSVQEVTVTVLFT